MLVACGDPGRDTTPRYGAPVAEVAGKTLDASVVAMIAERDDVDEATARERALDTLRLAADYEQAQAAQAAEAVLIDPAREAHLLRSARARLWLEEDFEPKHRPEDIPADLIAANMGKRAIFHPEVHAICNAIVMPAAVDDETGRHAMPPDDAAWWARARDYLQPIEAALRRYIVDPSTEPGCGLFGRVARMAAPESDEFFLKVEQGGYTVCARDLWDPGFVDALCGLSEPAWVDPFRTEFGLHFVVVLQITPANEPDDAGKKAFLRERMHTPWRQQAFGEYMERLRAKRTVRFAAGVGAEAPAADPNSGPGRP